MDIGPMANNDKVRHRLPPIGVAGHLVVGVLVLLQYLAVRNYLIDDTYITLDYAHNVAHHFHWGIIESETANSATSALNVLLLSVVTLIVRNPLIALGIVYVANAVALWHVLRNIAAHSQLSMWLPVAGTALILTSPLLVSTAGLETLIGVTLAIYACWFALRARAVAFGVTAGLLVLTRPDLAVIAAFLFLLTPAIRARFVITVATAAGVVLPWLVFSWAVLGSLFPDTLLIKTMQKEWDGYSFSNGMVHYLDRFPVASILWLLPVVGGLTVVFMWLFKRRRYENLKAIPAPIIYVGASGIAYFVAFSLLGVPPYHWYYGPSTGALLFVVAAFLGAVGRHRFERKALPISCAIATAAICALSLGQTLRVWTSAATMPIMSNWATAAEYETIGKQAPAYFKDADVSSPGEIGTFAYYCDCNVVDSFSDRGAVNDLIAARQQGDGPTAALMRLNFAFYEPQPARIPQVTLDWEEQPPAAGRPSWKVATPYKGEGWVVLNPKE